MKDTFALIKKRIRTNNPDSCEIIAINGCCYGRSTAGREYRANGDYFKYCGQRFWEFISDDANLYTDIIEPLGYKAKQRNEEFIEKYSIVINKFGSSD